MNLQQTTEFIPPPTTDFMEAEIANINPIEDADRRETRCLVFAGNVLPPFFKRTFQGMGMGGENLGQNYKTLAPTKGLLRRCQLTPMVVGYDYLNADTLGDEKSKVKSRTVYDEGSRQNFILYYNECLPGDELAGILRSQQGANDKGIREVAVLKGVEPSAYKTTQYEIFPDWGDYVTGAKEFFATTAALAEYLQQRKTEVSAAASKAIDVILDSNTQFERWATGELARFGRLVKAAPTDGGKVYAWEDNPSAPEWFKMLNLNREEFLMSQKDEPQKTNQVDREEFEEYKKTLKSLANLVKPLAEIAVAQNAPKAEDFTGQSCADLNGKNEPCGSKVSKKIGDKYFCHNHPKDE